MKITTFSFTTDYNLYKLIKNHLEQFDIYNLKEDFAEEITLSGEIRASQFSTMSEILLNISNGKIKL